MLLILLINDFLSIQTINLKLKYGILPVSFSNLGEAARLRGAHVIALSDQVSAGVEQREHTGLSRAGPPVHRRAGEPGRQPVRLAEEVEQLLHTWDVYYVKKSLFCRGPIVLKYRAESFFCISKTLILCRIYEKNHK